ncbi:MULTISPECIES: hypothetical protein [unclassified Rhodococcus (in: high G+C Gram-positive bacteria)]|uniref:hypothetical protein n=1 Tax=unclassified Rhodococcus (in: high G+C Gram-positive bacteria) TaxID=192944 RepID=UPI000AB4DE5B|nr:MULTISPECIES: hypothetical protein [unclassified Rhodococcus (in: high G+C Gram-positive bacteria)]
MLEYKIEPPASWNELMAERLRHHAKTFGLLERFGEEMTAHVPDQRLRLRDLLNSGDQFEVAQYLSEEAASKLANNQNGFLGVGYQALAADQWFCGGGFSHFF